MLLVLLAPAVVSASMLDKRPDGHAACRTVSPPATIGDSGCYSVTKDFSTDDPGQFALVVTADRVTLDLGGHRLAGAGAASVVAGIHVLGSQRLTLRNGTISGFLFGLRAEPYNGRRIDTVLVENLVVKAGTARGLAVTARDVTIRDSRITNLSGFAGWPASHAMGIELNAEHCLIQGNLVADIYPEGVGEAVGISLSSGAERCMIADNVIVNRRQPEVGRAMGFWIAEEQARRAPGGLTVGGNAVRGHAYAFMAPPKLAGAFKGNEFVVDCGPDSVEVYGSAGSANAFSPTAAGCRDTVPAIERRAASGDPRWSLRLATRLHEIEDPAVLASMKTDRCQLLARARGLLDPLIALDVAGAAHLMKRVKNLARPCR